jgi:hypothetical protein
VTANNQASTEKDWKAPAVKMRRSGRLGRYVETFSIRFTTSENRPEQTNHKQSILRLHWLTHQRKGGRHGDGTIGGKWAVSTDGGWTQKPSIVDRERHTAMRGQPWHTADSLWQNWGSLEGGGNPGHTAEPDNQMEEHGPREEGSLIQPSSSTQGHETGVAIISIRRRVVPQPDRKSDHGQATQVSPRLKGTSLAVMTSLRGPLARCNRARFPDGNGTDTPVTYEPTDIRYPCNAKWWKLGVGWSSGAPETEGVFAIEKNTEDVAFKAGQQICSFRGHQQSKRPRQVNNHAWAHNGIREGTPGCIYINAFNNQESPTRWFQMAGHEDLANCRIQSMPRQQGGGLGIYAVENIWNRQELLLANREYPTSESAEITADALASATETLEENRTDADDPAKDAGDAAEAQGETLGHQYATCDDTGGCRMHKPNQPWTDGILVQQRTPSPVDNIPRWTSLTDEYRQVEISIAEATSLRKDL